MVYLTGKQKLAAVLLCALALIGAGLRLFLVERGGSVSRNSAPTAADSAVVARLALKLADYTGPVRINTADARILERLPGVGPQLAARIVKERGRGGPFNGPDDIAARVKGIGPATVARWGESVTFRDSASREKK